MERGRSPYLRRHCCRRTYQPGPRPWGTVGVMNTATWRSSSRAHFLQGNVTCSLRTLFFWSGRWSVTYPVTALAFLGAGMSTT